MERTTMSTMKPRQFARMTSLAGDPRVRAIQEAVAACDAAGRRRLHVANGEYAWPRNVVALLDEMQLNGVPDAQILMVGDMLRDAAYHTVYRGTGVPKESLGEALAVEAIAEGEANRDAARLIDRPHDASLKRATVKSLSWHASMIERAKRVLMRDLGGAA